MKLWRLLNKQIWAPKHHGLLASTRRRAAVRILTSLATFVTAGFSVAESMRLVSKKKDIRVDISRLIESLADDVEDGAPLSGLMRKYRDQDLSKNRYRINDLHDGLNFVTVEGMIIEILKPILVETRYGKTNLVKAIIEDETGKIPLCLFGVQSEGISVGDSVRIEKGYVANYEGETYLGIPKGYGGNRGCRNF